MSTMLMKSWWVVGLTHDSTDKKPVFSNVSDVSHGFML